MSKNEELQKIEQSKAMWEKETLSLDDDKPRERLSEFTTLSNQPVEGYYRNLYLDPRSGLYPIVIVMFYFSHFRDQVSSIDDLLRSPSSSKNEFHI